jgi:hypothetical protein
MFNFFATAIDKLSTAFYVLFLSFSIESLPFKTHFLSSPILSAIIRQGFGALYDLGNCPHAISNWGGSGPRYPLYLVPMRGERDLECWAAAAL